MGDPLSARRRPHGTDADSPRDPARPRTAGRRRAARHYGTRGSLFRFLPSMPAVAGVAVLAVAAAGAVSVSEEVAATSSPTRAENRVAQAGALSGSSAVSSTSLLDEREEAVSRDSARDALEDASVKKIIAAAEAQAQERNAALARFAQQAEKQAALIALNKWVLPLDGYRLSATFGQSSGLWAHTHTGLDFAAPSGTPIKAIANGVITSTGYDGSYGNKTVQTLDDGTELWYCHQTSFAASPGQQVRAGEVIGYVGSTGNSTGPHLHLEVRPGAGDPVDPYTALSVHGLTP